MYENLSKFKTSVKTGDNNEQKVPVLNKFYIFGCTFLMPS